MSVAVYWRSLWPAGEHKDEPDSASRVGDTRRRICRLLAENTTREDSYQPAWTSILIRQISAPLIQDINMVPVLIHDEQRNDHLVAVVAGIVLCEFSAMACSSLLMTFGFSISMTIT